MAACVLLFVPQIVSPTALAFAPHHKTPPPAASIILSIARTSSSPWSRQQLQRRQLTWLFVLTTPESIIEQASTTSLLDDLIDESIRTSARRPLIMQFDPSSGWIWKRWKGTVFSETWESCVSKMIYASIVFGFCATYPGIKTWLSGFNVLWGQLLSVTTFTLTFFVNQSYALWRKCMELSRRLQGRLHDLDMSLAAHAARKPPASPNEPSTYTAASHQLLELISRYVRVFNLLTYASFTRSHRPILTPRGMRRLVERGLLTKQERRVLVDAEIPATQRHNAVLLWIMRAFVEGREAGHFAGGAGFEDQWLEKVHVCRAQYGGIGDELQGRMPLAYAHIVQVLVDIILWMYPFMAFSSGMSGFLTVVGTGLLTVSYQGLFDLAKQFLDPYDNESYGKGEDPLVVDTLIAETNAGSVRWMNGLNQFPLSSQRIKDGELSDYLLPLRGYTLEELAQIQEEKERKERELQERREREEEARRKAAEEERRLLEAAEAMIPGLWPNGSSPGFGDLTNASFALAINGEAQEASSDHSWWIVSPSAVESTIKVLDILPSLEVCDDVVASLVPDETAPAEPEIVCLDAIKEQQYEEEEFPTLFGGEEIDDSYFEEINGDEESSVNGDGGYVHAFDAFDPYGDLPWFDEVGPDGQETRLSQMLADELWEEEVEYSREREPRIRTFAEFAKKASDIIESKNTELFETQEILRESPGRQSASSPVRSQSDATPKYDQTKLDGLSQLWGLPPGEISDIPVYQVPPVEQVDGALTGISQLWGGSIDAGVVSPPRDDLVDSFDSISQLWGEDDESASLPTSTGTRSVRDGPPTGSTRRIKGDPPSRSDAKDLRISQILADEMWSEELEAQATEPITYEDYTRQVREILDAEKEELLETAAILSAPPGADSVAVEEQEPRPSLSLKDVNATAVLGASSSGSGSSLDDDFNSYMEAVKAEEELLETQAILNAPPAAESVELPEREATISIDYLPQPAEPIPSQEDDLAILEMDDDSIGTIPVRKTGKKKERSGDGGEHAPKASESEPSVDRDPEISAVESETKRETNDAPADGSLPGNSPLDDKITEEDPRKPENEA